MPPVISRVVLLLLGLAGTPPAATYCVDAQAKGASDTNTGTEKAPWKTIARAGAAKELRPGDAVLIRAGVYREHVQIKVSGAPGRPITFAAAPGARVVIKGSEVVRGRWAKLSAASAVKEPYPNAFADVWSIQLGEECFTDAYFKGCYDDRSRRWVSQVFVQDDRPLQRIGLDPIYKNDEYLKLTTVGRGLEDLIQDSFFFDAASQTLHVKMAGEPGWFDAENADIRILSNVAHHNDGAGIFFEINKGGGIIADNLVYANRGRGIYVSGSQNTWVVHNTVAANHAGIVCMSRGPEWPLENVRVFNNLLVRNGIAGEGHARGADLTVDMACPRDTLKRTLTSNHSDYNLYANTAWTPAMRQSWNPDNTLAEWQERFGEDIHSKVMPVDFGLRGTGFKLLTRAGLRVAARLPGDLPWKPPSPSRVGSSLTQWP